MKTPQITQTINEINMQIKQFNMKIQISGSVTNIDEDGSIAGAYFESENFSTNGSYEFNNVQVFMNLLYKGTHIKLLHIKLR